MATIVEVTLSQYWSARHHGFARERGAEVTSGRNVIFMPRFDRNALDNFLKAECSGETGKSNETTMLKIDGIGEWEYRYRS